MVLQFDSAAAPSKITLGRLANYGKGVFNSPHLVQARKMIMSHPMGHSVILNRTKAGWNWKESGDLGTFAGVVTCPAGIAKLNALNAREKGFRAPCMRK